MYASYQEDGLYAYNKNTFAEEGHYRNGMEFYRPDNWGQQQLFCEDGYIFNVEYQGQTTWLTDTMWMAVEKFQLHQAGPTSRITYIHIIGPERLHMTCDDIPGGADMLLHNGGFKFTPYLFRTPFAGRYLTVRCHDEALLDKDGVLHDHIKMVYAGIQLATMSMSITIKRPL